MTNNRSVLIISAIALILLAMIPAVSALDVIYDRDLYDYVDTSKSATFEPWPGYPNFLSGDVNRICFSDIRKAQVLNYLVIEIPGDHGFWLNNETKIEPGRYDITYNFNGKTRPGVLYLNKKTSLTGVVTSTQFTIFLNDWDIGDLTGKQYVTFPQFEFTSSLYANGHYVGATNVYLSPSPSARTYKVTESTGIEWKHHVKVEEDTTSYYVNINGFIDGHRYTSKVNLWKDNELYATFTNPGNDSSTAYLKTEINLLEIISPQGTEYAYPLYADDTPVDPDNIPVVVYVKSTQTGALLNDARIIIKDTNTVPWSEVVNQTLPSGYDVVYLKKDPGFDPTQYQISVTVPGYQQVVPTHFFRVTGPMSVVVEMEPLEGGPVDEDNTFLEFYVTDLDGNPVSNAQVYVGGQLRWTNAQGYTQFEVAKNTGYSYDVSKSGYVTVRGSATAGDGPRYTVNVVLGPKTDPTEPPITDPDIFPVNVYVKSSQTGALLANARVIIKDTNTVPWSEVVNQTFPSGHGVVSLAKDPGFDPTQYQISVTVPDYQQVVPALFFRVTGPTNVVVEMEPIEGGPVDENNTFLEFYVRNLDGNPVSNAQVSVGGQLRWTNAQGWIQFEVAKNASYPYTVSKSGYVTIEGTTTVGDGPRYTVNVVLGPKTDPTEPPGPGLPTPTGGIPDEDDDSDGFMMQAVRGIANLFGVSFGVGKTILGMLLALGIGTATAKHLRGGAQEFGMGMLGGVVLGVLIGLLPIWVLVLLVLIVGLWIGQRYMSGGDS
jgi:V8-like Glu-specific endopeptidase